MSARYRCMTSSVHICLTVVTGFLIVIFNRNHYKDQQVKRRCVREKFTEWPFEVWMFKFYIKKCYIRPTCSSETKQNFDNPVYLFSRLCEFDFLWSVSNQGPHDPYLSMLTKRLQRHLPYRWKIWNLYKKNIFPETSKIRRNSGNPKKTEIPVFRISWQITDQPTQITGTKTTHV